VGLIGLRALDYLGMYTVLYHPSDQLAYLRSVEDPHHAQSKACVQFLAVEAEHVALLQEPSLSYCAAEHFAAAYFDCHRTNTYHIIMKNSILGFSDNLASFNGTWFT